MIGGFADLSEGVVQVFDAETETWTVSQYALPWAGGSVATVAMGGVIYACSGLVHDNNLGLWVNPTDCARWDPAGGAGWAPVAPIPRGVNHAAAGTDGARMYVFGGRDNSCNCVADGLTDLQIYDVASDSWSTIAVPTVNGQSIVPRGGMGAAPYLAGEFFIMGGETKTTPGATDKRVFQQVEIYNPHTNTWRRGPDMPVAKHGMFPVADEATRSIWVAGGGRRAGNSKSPTVDRLAYVTGQA